MFLNQHVANTNFHWVTLIKFVVTNNKQKTFYHFLNCKYLHLPERKVSHLSTYNWSLRCSLNSIFPGKQNILIKSQPKWYRNKKSWYQLFCFATIANVLSLEGVMGAKCLLSLFRFLKHLLFSNLVSWCNSSDNSYTKCFISDIKFCFTHDESNLYLNFVQVQNVLINIRDCVFSFASDFVYYWNSHVMVSSVVFSIRNVFW